MALVHASIEHSKPGNSMQGLSAGATLETSARLVLFLIKVHQVLWAAVYEHDSSLPQSPCLMHSWHMETKKVTVNRPGCTLMP